MKARKCLFLLAFMLGTLLSANAQTAVRGVVKDTNGDEVIGANVVEKGVPGNGVITDIDGRFSFSVKSAKATLVVSFVGYATQEVPLNGKTNVTVTLEEDSKLLSDVVVIGYGTMKKGDITSAVASVKPEDFNIGNIQDAAELVKGKVAGLNITKGSGDPNATSTIRLRGVTTLTGNLDPLVLVDGVPGDMTEVAPENIASIDVLKDASAAAIYGTRGANGVILITTKGGQFGETKKVTYSGYVSASNFYDNLHFMTAADIRKIKNATAFSDEGFDTDWMDAITHTGLAQNHSINLEGGSANTSYAAGFSYRKEDGVMINTGNERMRMQFDVTQKALGDMLRFNLNGNLGYSEYPQNNPSYAYRQAVIHNPTSPIYKLDAEGKQDASLGYNEEFNRYQYYNPVEILNEQIGDSRGYDSKMTGNITFEPIQGWKTNLMLSTYRYVGVGENYYTSRYYTLAPSNVEGSTEKTIGSASKSQSDSKSDNLEITTQYQNKFGDHRIDAILGYSYNYNVYSGFSANNSNFPTEVYLYNNLGAGSLAELKYTDPDDKTTGYLKKYGGMSSWKNDDKLIGFFGRVSYGYADRYNVLLSIRHEGSSKFGQDRKWGNFPSASFGWTISNEEFMENVDAVSNLKLRLGYGKTGNIPGSSYGSLTVYDYDTSYGRYLNTSGQWVAGLVTSQNPNPKLKWETAEEFNVGLDMGFFGDRLSITVDGYRKVTNDLLYYYTVPVPPNIYTSTTANAAKFQNTGVELLIQANPISTKDFDWNTTLTASHNSSLLVSLSNELYETDSYINWGGVSDPISVSTHRIEEGTPFGNFWMLKSVGVNAKGKWVIENPNAVTQQGSQWLDKDGNEVDKYMVYSTALNSDEYRQYCGNGLPKAYLNWGNSFRYRNFDLGVQLSSQLGFYIFNSQRAFYQNNSIAYNRLYMAAVGLPIVDLETGKPTGELAKLSTSQQQCVVSDYLERGDYVKIDNVTLGYSREFKGNVRKYVQNARIYVSGENLFCFTKYSGLDPELSNGDPFAAGLDERDKYPTIRSFTGGISLTF